MDWLDVLTLCKQYGPLVVVIFFFLWRDWKRENYLSSRIEALETEMRGVILPMVRRCTRVIARNTVVMRRLIDNDCSER